MAINAISDEYNEPNNGILRKNATISPSFCFLIFLTNRRYLFLCKIHTAPLSETQRIVAFLGALNINANSPTHEPLLISSTISPSFSTTNFPSSITKNSFPLSSPCLIIHLSLNSEILDFFICFTISLILLLEISANNMFFLTQVCNQLITINGINSSSSSLLSSVESMSSSKYVSSAVNAKCIRRELNLIFV